jgi:hypothetical protein
LKQFSYFNILAVPGGGWTHQFSAYNAAASFHTVIIMMSLHSARIVTATVTALAAG